MIRFSENEPLIHAIYSPRQEGIAKLEQTFGRTKYACHPHPEIQETVVPMFAVPPLCQSHLERPIFQDFSIDELVSCIVPCEFHGGFLVWKHQGKQKASGLAWHWQHISGAFFPANFESEPTPEGYPTHLSMISINDG